jgi:transposase
VSFIPERRNDESSIEARYRYALQFLELSQRGDPDKIFFLDELGFNVSMRSTRGWAPVGERATQVVPGLRTRNISVCCTMSRNGAFHYRKQSCPFNRETFGVYLDELLAKFERVGLGKVVIIMDNARFHHYMEIREKILSKGHGLGYLPAYSPFLNPIENMFSQWKQLVRSSNSSNEDELLQVIDESFERISGEQCSNYFLHMLDVLDKCLEREEIVND